MQRLDARVSTDLPARALYLHQLDRVEVPVTVREISLGGALICGLPCSGTPELRLRSELPQEGPIELRGMVVRRQDSLAAVKFFTPPLATARSLWKHIRRGMGRVEACPHCRHRIAPSTEDCPACGRYVAFDSPSYIEKHFSLTAGRRLQDALAHLGLEEVQSLLGQVEQMASMNRLAAGEIGLLGQSPAMERLFRRIDSLAAEHSPVLVLGERGTEKARVARAIHEKSARRGLPFVELNVASLSEGFLEPELFGYLKGAFSQADETRRGMFEAADGGSIFIDDLDALPPGVQARLFCFFKDGMVERMGTRVAKKVDVRLMGGLFRAPVGLEEAGLLSVMNPSIIEVPALRERGEDLVLLADSLLKRLIAEAGGGACEFSPEALDVIGGRGWAGNLVELEHFVKAAFVRRSGSRIEAADLEALEPQGRPAEKDLRTEIARSQKEQVSQALEASGYVIAHAAKSLGISRPSLYALMRKHNLGKPH